MDEIMSEGEKRILDAAEELFSAHGFSAASIQKIAHLAGVSKSTIFHHFSSKDTLYLAVMKRACLDIGEILKSLEENSWNAAKPLRSFSKSHLDNLFDQERASRLILRELLDSTSQRGQVMAGEVFGEHFSRLITLVQTGQEEGLLRTDMDAADVAIAVVALNVFLFESWTVLQYLPGGHFTNPSTSGERLMRLLLLGIADRGEKI